MRRNLGTASQVAHVWAHLRQPYGEGGTRGNIYFDGRTLFSYGAHFVLGIMMAPGGPVLLNSSGYSVTTSKHKGEASYATHHMTRYHVPDLTEIRYAAERLATCERAADRRRYRAEIVRHIRKHAASYSEESAAYLLSLVGLGIATFHKAQRDADKAAKAAKVQAAKAERLARERRAKAIAEMTDSEFRAAFPEDGRYNDSWAEKRAAEFGRELARVHKAAKAAGFSAKRVGIIWRRVKEYREHFAGRDERFRKAARREMAATIRAWRNGTRKESMPPTPYVYDRFPAIHKALESAWTRYRADKAAYEEEQRTRAMAGFEAWQAGKAERPAETVWLTLEAARIVKADAERTRLQDWRDGKPGVYPPVRSLPDGSALLRVRGENLETSMGASVPLSHAIRVFRFAKLCRERGEEWQRNGRTLRVGHFQVDSVASDGSFRAGCHVIGWPEIEAAAKQAGVFDLPATDTRESRDAA